MNTTILANIRNKYNDMSSSEKIVADFFLNNKHSIDFSSKHMKEILFVSEATLSRFAKKCGYHGYREFIYDYKQSLLKTDHKIDKNIENVVNTYHQLLQTFSTVMQANQIDRIVTMMEQASQVYVYGMGSSGLVAHEMKSRFMRIGLNIEAISDNELILMQSILTDKTKLVIGLTISGSKNDVCTALLQARYNKAKTILVTANEQSEIQHRMNETIIIPSFKNLDIGNIISPQFVLLVFVDILYSSYRKIDVESKANQLQLTLKTLKTKYHGD